MSLVSAIPGDEASEESGSEQHASVYQRSGKPLSREALYRAKLKYGVYQSPAQGLKAGVVDSKQASDAAANIANKNKTTIEAYKRLLNPNASKAASALSASVIGEQKSAPVQQNDVPSVAASSAAVAAPKKVSSRASSHVGPAPNLGVGRSRASSNAAASATATASLTANSPTPVTQSPTSKMNFTKVLAGAERNAAEMVHNRINPDKVTYVKGISDRNVGKAADASFSLTSDFVSRLPTKLDYVEAAEKESHSVEWAQKAVAALKDFNPDDVTDPHWREREEQRNKLIKSLSSEAVLNKARYNAQQRLDTIDRETSYKAIFRNDEYNRAAVAVAQENLKKTRSADAVTANKVNLGGGLWLAPGDIDNIAKGLIAPVLDEVDQRTGAQRAMDADIAKRDQEYRVQYAEWVNIQTEKHTNDTLLQAKAFERRNKEAADLEAVLNKKYADLCTKKDAEVLEMEKLLESKKAELVKLKEDLEEELRKEDERNAAECAELERNNQLDLENSTREQEELLAPFKAELAAAEQYHEDLKSQKADIEKNIEELRASIEAHKQHVEELNVTIAEHEQKLQAEGEELNNLADSHQVLKEDLDTNYVAVLEKSKEEAKISSEEARLKQLEVDALINERQTELSNTEIQLKKEKLNLIDALKEVAEVKNEGQIDEEKAKAFLGTTSSEFVASQQKKEVKPVATAAIPEQTTAPAPTAAPAAKETHEDDKVLNGVGFIPLKSKKGLVQRGNSIKKFFGIKKSSHSSAASPAEKPEAAASTEKQEPVPAEQPTAAEQPAATELEPTFSGFSQGSVENRPTDESDDAINKKENRKSLFKEVF